MRIAAVRATPINLPLEAPYRWAHGELPGFSPTIVEVETSNGIVGLGEAPSWRAVRLITEALARRLIGQDPIDIAAVECRCLPSWRGVQSTDDRGLIGAFGAVEMALWDIRGQAWGEPLHRLLGGAVRHEVAFTDYFAFRAPGRDGAGGEATPEAVVDYCQRLREEHGTTLFEGKLSTADPAPSLRTVELLRRRLGEGITIRVDSNQAYSLATARMLGPALDDLGVANWEDPVGTAQEMALLRRHCRVPFSTHNIDLSQKPTHGVPDAIVTNPTQHGGIGRMLRFVGACEAQAVDCWCYSGDSGIASAAYLHLCAALEWMRQPSQSLFRMQPLDVIEEGPFRPRHNVVRVPQGPGLGVTLSPERLAHCHRLFVEHGPMDKHHDPERPGVHRRLPLP